MPDFERVTDQLAIDLADTPERRAWVEGWIAGKRVARKQVTVVVAFFAVLALVIAVHAL